MQTEPRPLTGSAWATLCRWARIRRMIAITAPMRRAAFRSLRGERESSHYLTLSLVSSHPSCRYPALCAWPYHVDRTLSNAVDAFPTPSRQGVYGLDAFPSRDPVSSLRPNHEHRASRSIFDFAHRLVGHWRGGLGQSTSPPRSLLGMSGSAVADSMVIGQIEIRPCASRKPYDFSVAVTAASATIGPSSRPAIPLIIYRLSPTFRHCTPIAGILPVC